MLTIGFIFPSSDYLHDPFRGDPHTHFQILTVLENALRSSVKVSLIDLRGVDKKFAVYHIPECDVYLHSVYTLDFEEQKSIVGALRERYPLAKHIAGGPHAAVFQEECLKIFDSLIIGDGERSIVRAVGDIMSYRLEKKYIQETPVDINNYPYPRRHYLPASAVARKGLLMLKDDRCLDDILTTTTIFSRGCPFNCYFCAMPELKKYSPGIRFRSAESVTQEIEYLKKEYGIGGISMLDELAFPPGAGKALPYIEAIGRTGIKWKAQCRVDGVTPEIARSLKAAGCVIMCLGIESVWQDSLDRINKKIDLKKTRESIRLLKENGIETRVYMIMGLPGEPEDIVDRTWSFIKETSPDLVYMCLLTVRPGTRMYDNPSEFGFKCVTTDWAKTMHLFGRYEDEKPTLTFEYAEKTPWGKGMSAERITANYLEIQRRLVEAGLARR
jgi:radical SAM superfamily enzyme YgiQ (UPF0313 family)